MQQDIALFIVLTFQNTFALLMIGLLFLWIQNVQEWIGNAHLVVIVLTAGKHAPQKLHRIFPLDAKPFKDALLVGPLQGQEGSLGGVALLGLFVLRDESGVHALGALVLGLLPYHPALQFSLDHGCLARKIGRGVG